MEITEIIQYGIVTEESVSLQNTRPIQGSRERRETIIPRYTFRVAPTANKYQIRDAVEKLFGVKVVAVNTMRMPGKKHVLRTKRGMRVLDARPWKKAIVTLAEGQSIPELNP